jgi:hypothetical protein
LCRACGSGDLVELGEIPTSVPPALFEKKENRRSGKAPVREKLGEWELGGKAWAASGNLRGLANFDELATPTERFTQAPAAVKVPHHRLGDHA